MPPNCEEDCMALERTEKQLRKAIEITDAARIVGKRPPYVQSVDVKGKPIAGRHECFFCHAEQRTVKMMDPCKIGSDAKYTEHDTSLHFAGCAWKAMNDSIASWDKNGGRTAWPT